MSEDNFRENHEQDAVYDDGSDYKPRFTDRFNPVLCVFLVLLMIWFFVMLRFSNSYDGLGGAICVVVLGAGLVLFAITNRIYKLKRCSATVTALCVDVDVHRTRKSDGGSSTTHAATWEYYFEGRLYRHKETNYQSGPRPKEGKEYELRIDPNNPHYIFRKGDDGMFVLIFTGLGFMTFSLLNIFGAI